MIAAVHVRMPVILEPDGYELWLDPGMRDVTAAVRTVEASRCSANAALSREHSDQSRRERRRGMLRDRGTRPDSGSALHSVELIL